MSAAAIRPSPPARAGPPTRATTGFGHSQTAASTSPMPAPAGHLAATRERGARVSFRSAPEQKTGPVWLSTIDPHRVVGDRRGQRRSSSSSISAEDSALRLCGLSRVSVATPALRPSVTRTDARQRTVGHARAD